MSAPARVSAVIVNRDGLAHLPGCLNALDAAGSLIAERLVVDDGSTDASADWVRARPGAALLAFPSPGGPGRARNAGLDAAREELVLLLDCDARVRPGAVELMIGRLAADPSAAIVCPLVAADGEGLLQHGPADCHLLGLGAFEGWWTRAAPDAAWGTRRFSACGSTALLVHKGRLPAGLRFDEGFGFYCEDADFALRAAAAGSPVVCEPRAVVRHANARLRAEASGSAGYPPEKMRLQSRNRRWLMIKTYDARTLILTAPLQAAFELATAAWALREGLLASYLSGWASFFRGLPGALRQRRRVQAGKTVDDRDLLTARSLSLRPSVTGRGASPVLDGVCRAWWAAAGGRDGFRAYQ